MPPSNPCEHYFGGVLSAIAIVPSAPVMVPELASAAASETADLRAAAVSAVEALPRRWVGVGVAATDSVAGPESVGTFAGYGADVCVGLSDRAVAARRSPVQLPLCVLITAWLRGLAQSAASARVHALASEPFVQRADRARSPPDPPWGIRCQFWDI